MADPAVFLDRDGTLIDEVGYATRPEQIRILGGVAGALADLARAGYKLIVVTNQSAIARGLATEQDLERFHAALDRHLDLLGARLDAYYTCPHHPDPGDTPRRDLAVECECRKPKPGLILRAAADLGLDLAASWMVGDTWRDIAAGQAAGVRTIKLPADPALEVGRPPDVAPPTAEARSLAQAARIILGTTEVRSGPVAPAVEPSAEPSAPPPEEAPEEPPAEPVPSEAPAPTAEVREVAPETPPESVPEPPAPPEEPVPIAPLGAAWPRRYVAEPPAPPEEPVAVEAPSPPEVPEPAPEETPDVESSEPVPAATAAGCCARCGRDLLESDVAEGAAAWRGEFLLCAECLAHQVRERDDALGGGAVELLRSILVELRRLNRAQQGPSLTWLRMAAYLVEAGAVFCGLALVLVGPDKVLYIQIAIFLQLLVIALVLFERRP